MAKEYEVKARTKTITATSRASIKVGDSFYTLEFTEERTIPQTSTVNLTLEKDMLWDEVNLQVDKQIEDVLRTFKK